MSEPMQTTALGAGFYLYCLARPSCLGRVAALGEITLRGVDERYPVTLLTETNAEAQVVAVISEVDIGDFSEENLQTLPWVGERAGQHETVVAEIMETSPVLPVKFGTIFRTHASLAAFMATHRKAIDQALDALRDKTEWSVKGYLEHEDAARQIFAAADPGISLRRSSLSASPGARYLQQKQLDVLIEKALEAGVARVTGDLQQALQQAAVAATQLRCHSSAMTGRPERMVFNASFLLAPDALPEFRRVLAEQQMYDKKMGLSLELRGPWPPYNFCPDLSEATP